MSLEKSLVVRTNNADSKQHAVLRNRNVNNECGSGGGNGDTVNHQQGEHGMDHSAGQRGKMENTRQPMDTKPFTPHNLLEWGRTGDESRAVHTAQSAAVGTDSRWKPSHSHRTICCSGDRQSMETEPFTPHNLLPLGQTGDENRAAHTAQSAALGTDSRWKPSHSHRTICCRWDRQVMKTELSTPHNLLQWGQTVDGN